MDQSEYSSHDADSIEENEHQISISQLHLEEDSGMVFDEDVDAEEGYVQSEDVDAETAADSPQVNGNETVEQHAPSNKRKHMGDGTVDISLQTSTPAQKIPNEQQNTTTPIVTDIPLEALPTKHTISIEDFSFGVQAFKVLCHNMQRILETSSPSSREIMETLLSLNSLVEILRDDASLHSPTTDSTSLLHNNIQFFIYFCIPFTVKFIMQNNLMHFDRLSASELTHANEQMLRIYADISGPNVPLPDNDDDSEPASPTSFNTAPKSLSSQASKYAVSSTDKSITQPFILTLIEKYLYNVLNFFVERLEPDAQRNRQLIEESWKRNPLETKIKDLPEPSHLFQTIELLTNHQYFFYQNNGVYSRNPKLFNKDMTEFSSTSIPEQDWRTHYQGFVFATPVKSRKDQLSAYYVRHLNFLGRLGGFHYLLNFLENSEFNTPHMMLICLRVLHASCHALNQRIVEDLPGLCFESVRAYFGKLGDKQLRAFKFGAFEDMIKIVQAMAHLVPQKHDENQYRDLLQLSLYYSCFSSNLVDARMKGLAQLKQLIKEVVQDTQDKKNSVYFNPPPGTRWLTTKQLVLWLEEHKIMERLTSGDLNLTVIQQSKPLLLFLGRYSSITSEDVDALWNAASGKHVSVQQCTFNLILTMLPFLSLQTVLHVMDRFEETQLRHLQVHMLEFLREFVNASAHKFKKRISLDAFWALMQDNKQVPLELSQRACAIIEDLISQPEFEHQRKTLIQLCCENIKMNLSVTQTLNLLKHIISTYPMKNKKKNSVWGVIDQLNEKYGLIQILLDSLTTQAGIFTPQKTKATEAVGRNCTLRELIEIYKHPSEEQQRSSRYSPEKKVDAKLTFLTYLLKHSNVSLSYAQCESLWKNLYEVTPDTKIRGIFIDWLKSTRSTSSQTQNILSDSTTEEVFERIIKRIDLRTMTLPTLYLFLHFLISLNIQDRKIHPVHTKVISAQSASTPDDTSSTTSDDTTASTPASTSSSKSKSFKDRLASFMGTTKKRSLKKSEKPTKFEILTNHLTGIDHVWKIILDADNVPVYKTAINFLNDFHFEFAPHLHNLESEFRRKHISVCMDKIKMAWHFAEEEVDVETNRRHILRCLDVLLDYIHLHTQQPGTSVDANGGNSGDASTPSNGTSTPTSTTSDQSVGNSSQIKLRVVVLSMENTKFTVSLKSSSTLKALYTAVQNRVGKNVRLYVDDKEVPCDATATVYDVKLHTNQVLEAKIKESKGFGAFADSLSSALGMKPKSAVRPEAKKGPKPSVSKKRNSTAPSSSSMAVSQQDLSPPLPITVLSENYFSDLIKLFKMHDDEVGDKLWKLLQELPKNATMVQEVEAFSEHSVFAVQQIFSAESVHLLLYRLEITDTFLKDADIVQKRAWKEAFVQRGGIAHLLSIMTSGGKNLSRTILHKKCYASVLSILNAVFDLLKKSDIELMEAIVDAVLESAPSAVDFQSGRPRAVSYRGHVRLNSSDMTDMVAAGRKAQVAKSSPHIDKKNALDETQKLTYYKVTTSIVCEMMDLLTSCAKNHDSIAQRICANPSTKTMIWNALVTFPDDGVREEMAEDVLELAGTSSFLSQFVVQYLFGNIDRIEYYEKRARDYFFVLEQLIPLCPAPKVADDEDSKTSLSSNAEQMDAECIRIVIEKILSRSVKEATSATEDPVLVGLIKVAKVLIARQSCAVKYELGSAVGGVGLISEIFHSCLFDAPTGGASSTTTDQPPKCKSPASRSAAYELLVELIVNCPQNADELLHLTRTYVLNNDESITAATERIPWRFKPQAHSKSVVGYVGLRNLGATCYINSLMQQLFMTIPFREGLLSVLDYNRTTSDNHQVLYQMQKLFGYLQDSAKSFFDLEEFCETYKDFEGNPINPGRQQDANEFFNFLFDKIEDALRGTPQASLLKDIFGGRLVNRTEFELDGKLHVNNMDEIFYGMNLEVKLQTSISGSLKLLNNGEMLKGDTAYYSEEHKKKVNAFRRTYIKQLPPVLIFHLKRFEFHISSMTSTKLNDKIQFPETLDMYPYTIEGVAESEEWDNRDEFKKKDPDYYHYTLVGVLVHSGGVNSGHYYSYIMDRSQVDRPWYEFNDCSLSKFDKIKLADECFGGVDEVSVRGEQGQQSVSKRKVFRQNNAYMLFYQRTSSLYESLDGMPRENGLETEVVQLGATETKAPLPSSDAKSHNTSLSSHWKNTMNAVNFLVRINHAKRQRQSTSSAPHKDTLLIPTPIKEEIWKDNTVYYYQRNVFDPAFDKFLMELAHRTEAPQETSFSLFLFYVFHILVRSSFQEKSLNMWSEFFAGQFIQSRGACVQFLEHFTKKNLVSLFITCPLSQVRSFTSTLLLRAIRALKEHSETPEEEMVYVQMGEGENGALQFGELATAGPSGTIVTLMQEVLRLFSEENTKVFRHNTTELFSFVYEFGLLGVQERNLLLALDFVLVIVQLLSSATDQVFSLHSSFGRQPLELAFSLISLLVRSCETVTTVKLQDAAPPPTFVEERTPGIEMSNESRRQLFQSPFYGSLIAQNVNVEALSDMLIHWCWESVQISKNFAKLLQKCIHLPPQLPKNVSLQDYLQPYFTIFLNLLLIQDSKREERTFAVLDSFLVNMLTRTRDFDPNVARLCLKFLIARREPSTRAWLNTKMDDVRELCLEYGVKIAR